MPRADRHSGKSGWHLFPASWIAPGRWPSPYSVHRELDLRRQEKEWGAMYFIGPFGVLGNLLVVRSPLFEVDEVEAVRQQAVHIARNSAMILHDARRYPRSNAPTLKQIIIDWPHLGVVRIGSPLRISRGGEERVLDGKDQATGWH